MIRHVLPKSPLTPLFQRGEFLPLAKGGGEGFYKFFQTAKLLRTFGFVLIGLFVTFSSAGADQGTFKKATFIPQWSPQAQFAGYYVAYEKGFYKKVGIDLTLLEGGPDHSSVEFLERRKADFATMWLATAIQRRSSGVRLVNIGQMLQRSALMLVAKKSRGIHRPQDLNGKKVSLWGADFQLQPRAFFKKYRLHVKVIPQSYSVNLFLRDGVDVASAMWYNEYHSILNSGLNPDELTTFFFHEHGLNFPEDGIYTHEENFKKDPEMSCAFVKASIEGWTYAFSHPEETLNIVLNHMLRSKVPVNKVHQRWMLNRMRDLIHPQDMSAPIGSLQPSDYDRVGLELRALGLIPRIPDYSSFFIRCKSHAEK